MSMLPISSHLTLRLQLVPSSPLPFALLPSEGGVPLCGGAGSVMDRGENTDSRQSFRLEKKGICFVFIAPYVSVSSEK